MRDDFLSSEWAGSHEKLSSAIAQLIDTIAVSLARLNEIQFEAPWRMRDDDARCG